MNCNSLGHEDVPATHEIQGLPSIPLEWVAYCERCVRKMEGRGDNYRVREFGDPFVILRKLGSVSY